MALGMAGCSTDVRGSKAKQKEIQVLTIIWSKSKIFIELFETKRLSTREAKISKKLTDRVCTKVRCVFV